MCRQCEWEAATKEVSAKEVDAIDVDVSPTGSPSRILPAANKVHPARERQRPVVQMGGDSRRLDAAEGTKDGV